MTLAFAGFLRAQYTPNADTRISYSYPAFTASGGYKIEARDVYLDGFSTRGRPIKRRLGVIFDPATGDYLYVFDGRTGIDGSSVASKKMIPPVEERTSVHSPSMSRHGILLFAPGHGTGALRIWESDRRAASLDNVESLAVAAVNAHVLEVSRTLSWPNGKIVQLVSRDGARIEPGFCAPPTSAFCEPINVVAVKESSTGWEVFLHGQWTERVILSSSFEVFRA